jgi:Ca2+-binding EF-hand superfamily protein
VNERYSESELREMVEYADTDKDGYINWEEF